MEEQKDSREHKYDQARQAFNDLGLEGRLTFLVQESAATLMHACSKVADSIEESCASFFGGFSSKGGKHGSTTADTEES